MRTQLLGPLAMPLLQVQQASLLFFHGTLTCRFQTLFPAHPQAGKDEEIHGPQHKALHPKHLDFQEKSGCRH